MNIPEARSLDAVRESARYTLVKKRIVLFYDNVNIKIVIEA